MSDNQSSSVGAARKQAVLIRNIMLTIYNREENKAGIVNSVLVADLLKIKSQYPDLSGVTNSRVSRLIIKAREAGFIERVDMANPTSAITMHRITQKGILACVKFQSEGVEISDDGGELDEDEMNASAEQHSDGNFEAKMDLIAEAVALDLTRRIGEKLVLKLESVLEGVLKNFPTNSNSMAGSTAMMEVHNNVLAVVPHRENSDGNDVPQSAAPPLQKFSNFVCDTSALKALEDEQAEKSEKHGQHGKKIPKHDPQPAAEGGVPIPRIAVLGIKPAHASMLCEEYRGRAEFNIHYSDRKTLADIANRVKNCFRILFMQDFAKHSNFYTLRDKQGFVLVDGGMSALRAAINQSILEFNSGIDTPSADVYSA